MASASLCGVLRPPLFMSAGEAGSGDGEVCKDVRSASSFSSSRGGGEVVRWFAASLSPQLVDRGVGDATRTAMPEADMLSGVRSSWLLHVVDEEAGSELSSGGDATVVPVAPAPQAARLGPSWLIMHYRRW